MLSGPVRAIPKVLMLLKELQTFAENHLLHWVEALSLLGELSSALRGLPGAITWCRVRFVSRKLLVTLSDITHFRPPVMSQPRWHRCSPMLSAQFKNIILRCTHRRFRFTNRPSLSCHTAPYTGIPMVPDIARPIYTRSDTPSGVLYYASWRNTRA